MWECKHPSILQENHKACCTERDTKQTVWGVEGVEVSRSQSNDWKVANIKS